MDFNFGCHNLAESCLLAAVVLADIECTVLGIESGTACQVALGNIDLVAYDSLDCFESTAVVAVERIEFEDDDCRFQTACWLQ